MWIWGTYIVFFPRKKNLYTLMTYCICQTWPLGMNYDIIIISFCVQYDNKTQGRNRIDLLAIYTISELENSCKLCWHFACSFPQRYLISWYLHAILISVHYYVLISYMSYILIWSSETLIRMSELTPQQNRTMKQMCISLEIFFIDVYL